MQTCNLCGSAISPEIGPPVLAQQGQVVCQPCWKKSGAAAPAAQRRPVTASRTAAVTGSARPATGSSRRTGATPAPSAARAGRTTGSSRTAAPAPRAAEAAEEGGETNVARHMTTRSQEIIQVGSTGLGRHAQKIVMIVMGVLVIAAGILFMVNKNKKAAEAEETARILKEADDGISAIVTAVQKYPEDFKRQLEVVSSVRDAVNKLQDADHKGKLINLENEIRTKQTAAKTSQEAMDLLTSAEADVQDPNKLDSVKAKMNSLEIRANTMGKEYGERVKKIKEAYSLMSVKKFADTARATKDGDISSALNAYDTAIRSIYDLVEKLPKPPPEMIEIFKAVLGESDALVEKLVTPEYEAKIPERDLLSPKEKSVWGNSDGIKWELKGKEMVVEGVEVPGRKIVGVFSAIPPVAEMWQDIILDVEFTITAGDSFTSMYRYLPGKKAYELGYKVDPNTGFQLNKNYHQIIRVVGSSFTQKESGNPDQSDKLGFSVSRTGGIGFALKPGTKMVFSTFKVKVLRTTAGVK